MLIAALAYCGAIHAQDDYSDFVKSNQQDNWGFTIAPYVMFASQATDVGGEKIRQSFKDLASLTNSGFQIVGTIRYKKWTSSVDGTFANLGFEENEGFLDLKLKIIQTILDLRLGYEVYKDFKFDDKQVIKGWSLEINAGTKYWRNDLGISYNLDLGNAGNIDESINEKQRWWDLMIGVKLKFVLSKKVLLGVSASGGGFGIGNSNNFSSDFTFSNSFLVSDLLMINAGFRNFRYKRTDSTVDGELKTKVNVLGPLLGVTFRL